MALGTGFNKRNVELIANIENFFSFGFDPRLKGYVVLYGDNRVEYSYTATKGLAGIFITFKLGKRSNAKWSIKKLAD